MHIGYSTSPIFMFLPHRRRYTMLMIWGTDWLQRGLGAAVNHRRGHWPVV